MRIVGTSLPGTRHGHLEHVHVGMQRGREVVDMVSADAERAVFELDIEVVRNRRAPTSEGHTYTAKKASASST
jgi:hypothetical protein